MSLPFRIVVDGWTGLPEMPNRCYDLAYREWHRDAAVFMPSGFAQVAGFWMRHRWDIHRLLVRLGFLEVEEGCEYRSGFLHWDFWNGSASWSAFRFLRKRGLEAYNVRYRPQHVR